MVNKDESFSQEFRIKSPADFERAFQSGIVAADGVLVIHAGQNNLTHPRLGLSISRRYGNAPQRNRWKRWVRECFRKQKGNYPCLDIVVRPKRGSVPDYAKVDRSLSALIKRIERKSAK